VDLLLSGGAQVNRSNAQGASALHEVCMNGQLKLCRMLLESGAHLQTKNVYGIRPLFIAAQHGHADIIQLLVKKGEPTHLPINQSPSGADVKGFLKGFCSF